ncbi:MAG: hypothetical protein WBE65_09180 [Steroidobacteraceae bacterium]
MDTAERIPLHECLRLAFEDRDFVLPDEGVPTDEVRGSGRITPRQLAWLLATAVPAPDVARLPDITAELGAGVHSLAEATSLSALLTRIGDAGGRYQCEECGLNSVGWYWHCPKCRAWDSLRPAVFKWADRADQSGHPA